MLSCLCLRSFTCSTNMYYMVVFDHHFSLCSSYLPSLSVWQDIFKALTYDLQRLWAGFGDRQQLVSKRGQTAMIYSQADLTGEKLLLPQLPLLLNSHTDCMLFHQLLHSHCLVHTLKHTHKHTFLFTSAVHVWVVGPLRLWPALST